MLYLHKKKSFSVGWVMLASTVVPAGTLPARPDWSRLSVQKRRVWCRFCTAINVIPGM